MLYIFINTGTIQFSKKKTFPPHKTTTLPIPPHVIINGHIHNPSLFTQIINKTLNEELKYHHHKKPRISLFLPINSLNNTIPQHTILAYILACSSLNAKLIAIYQHPSTNPHQNLLNHFTAQHISITPYWFVCSTLAIVFITLFHTHDTIKRHQNLLTLSQAYKKIINNKPQEKINAAQKTLTTIKESLEKKNKTIQTFTQQKESLYNPQPLLSFLSHNMPDNMFLTKLQITRHATKKKQASTKQTLTTTNHVINLHGKCLHHQSLSSFIKKFNNTFQKNPSLELALAQQESIGKKTLHKKQHRKGKNHIKKIIFHLKGQQKAHEYLI